MTPEQLKISILQSAVRGEIVSHITEKSLLAEISLIRNSVDYKKKKMDKITIIEDFPYEIPENWIWVRLGEVAEVIRGLTFSESSKTQLENTILVLRGGNINSQTEKLIYDDNIYVDKKIPKEEQILRKGDCLVVASSGTKSSVGKSCYIENIPEFTSFGGFMMVVRSGKYIDPKLLSYHIKLYRQKIINDTAGYISNITNPILNNLLIPLPPLEEQHRIVAKIEELLPYVDRYAEAYEKLERFNAKFPEEMKKSILQYAIQGKLVEQRPEEGTAEELYQQIQKEKQKLIKEGKIKKEKPLADITEDEIPFDIPESWKWVRLGKCGIFERGSGIKKDEVTPGGFPCVRYGQLYTTFKTRFENAVSCIPKDIYDKCHKAKQGDILMSLTGENEYDIALAVTYEGKEEIAIGGDMTKFYGHGMNPLYLTYVMNSQYGILCKSKMASGNIIVHISNDKLATIPIPLPPLEEQHRIVAKIEELLPYCDQLIHK